MAFMYAPRSFALVLFVCSKRLSLSLIVDSRGRGLDTNEISLEGKGTGLNLTSYMPRLVDLSKAVCNPLIYNQQWFDFGPEVIKTRVFFLMFCYNPFL